MPRRKSSLKRNRADKKRRLKNLRVKKDIKSSLKKFQALLSANNFEEAKPLLYKLFSKLDKAAKKGIIHKNTTRRKKSRLVKRLNAQLSKKDSGKA